MQSVRLSGARAARQTCRSSLNRQQPRRFAHDEHHGASSGGHHHEIPAEEGLGKSFWYILTGLPVAYVVYDISRKDDSYFTKLLAQYADFKSTWQDRAEVHTKMVQQAAHDRNLFIHTPMPQHIDLAFPEVFNSGGKLNVPTSSGVDLTKVFDHYREQAFAEEEEKQRRLAEAKQARKKKSKPQEE